MINKKSILFAGMILGIFLILSLSFAASQANDPENNSTNNSNNSNGNSNHSNNNNSNGNGNGNHSSNDLKIRKINYGLCVSNSTNIKNDCYREVKDKYELCRNNSFNSVLNNYTNFSNPQFNETNINDKAKKNRYKFINLREVRNLLQDCRFTYVEELRECKQEFKNNKVQCNAFKCKGNQSFVNGTCVN
ncbi:MAG: hypothetical protein AABX03_01055 [Nanoarchaeota archaeon]